MKSNYRAFAITALLGAAATTAFCVSLAFKQYANEHKLIEAPYSLGYINDEPHIDNLVTDAIRSSEHRLLGLHKLQIAKVSAAHDIARKAEPSGEAYVIRHSEFATTLIFLGKEHSLVLTPPIDQGAYFIHSAQSVASPFRLKGDRVMLINLPYTIEEQAQLPVTGNIPGFGNSNIYVLADDAYDAMQLSSAEVTLNGVQIDQPERSEPLVALELAGSRQFGKRVSYGVCSGILHVRGFFLSRYHHVACVHARSVQHDLLQVHV